MDEQALSGIAPISRWELKGDPNSVVLICPAKSERGLEFLLRYNAWGFIRVNRQPTFVALYVGRPESKVLYLAEVNSITPPLSSPSEVEEISQEHLGTFKPGKKVIWLKKGSIRRLLDPIPVGRAG